MSTEDEYASIGDLLADEVSGNTADVTLPNGKKVTVRGMSRAELAHSSVTDDPIESERRMLTACLLKPAMSSGQVTELLKAKGPMFLKEVVGTIRDLSGLGEGAGKSDVA